jgi:thioredoxin reductase (NADPH)
MSAAEIHKVVILGSGPAGLTAAVYTARANLAPLLIHGPLPGGQLTTTTEVENYPGFANGIMGPDLMAQMEGQAKRFGTQIHVDTVETISLDGAVKVLKTQSGEEIRCQALIVATGATPKLLGIKAEKELMGYGVSTCATCDGAFFRDRIITVVGGGDSACEEALFLTRFGSKVYMVHRRDEFRASKIMADRAMAHEKIEILWNSAVTDIQGNKNDGVQAMIVKNNDGSERTIATDAVFVAIGHTPNSFLFKDILTLDENGYIVPKPNSTQTNVEGIFACGDVQDHVFRQAITAAGTGCMAAIETERWLETLH